jgi:sarcosine oxidase delta subunit
MADMRLPIESHVLQAFVSEGTQADDRHGVVTYGAAHFYISQSDKGGLVFGGDIDGYNSAMPSAATCRRRGRDAKPCDGAVARSGALRMLRQLGRHHGHVDGRLADHRPHPVDGPLSQCGWCYGGFKATPASGWCFAHLIATRRRRTRWHGLPARPFHATVTASRREGPGARNRTFTDDARPRTPDMRIPCPLLQATAIRSEFVYRSDATPVAPGRGRIGPEAFHDYVYLRDNPAGIIREHTGIMPAAMQLARRERDTRTHAISDAALAARGRPHEHEPAAPRARRTDRSQPPAFLHASTDRAYSGYAGDTLASACSPTASGWSAARSNTTARAES